MYSPSLPSARSGNIFIDKMIIVDLCWHSNYARPFAVNECILYGEMYWKPLSNGVTLDMIRFIR
ncbi:MAG: hypothetical protein ACJAT7_001391 [Psychromonas sp.]|jgi:hypothetical protein